MRAVPPAFRPLPDDDVASPPDRARRASVMLSATVERFGGGRPTAHRVRDLSAGGVRIDRVDGMRAGETVVVSVGALEAVGATIRWARDGQAGLAFVEPIDPDQARARAAIRPRGVAGPLSPAGPAPAGWVAALRDPYR